MTIRGGIRSFISILGVGLLLALFDSGAAIADNSSWYATALMFAISGLLPREMAYGTVTVAAIVSINAIFSLNVPVMGLTWVHVALFAILSFCLFILSGQSEVRVMKCMNCYWHGPITRSHFGKCPACGQRALKETGQSTLTRL